MLRDEFETLLDAMIAEEKATILGKGEEYTRGQKDRLASFKESASFAGVKPIQVCMIYLNKHYQSLAHFVATGETKSGEPIEGRIMDLRVYMALMRALIQESRNPVSVPKITGGCRHIWTVNPVLAVGKEMCGTCGAIKTEVPA